jgi:hypothetical protein
LSAQVILQPASGSLTGYERITSDNVQGFLPTQEAVAEVSAYFRAAGFDVSESAGLGFSIAGSPEEFELVFGERPSRMIQGGVEAVQTSRGDGELPLDRLPEFLRRLIQAVAFTPPPDFGPTNP